MGLFFGSLEIFCSVRSSSFDHFAAHQGPTSGGRRRQMRTGNELETEWKREWKREWNGHLAIRWATKALLCLIIRIWLEFFQSFPHDLGLAISICLISEVKIRSFESCIGSSIWMHLSSWFKSPFRELLIFGAQFSGTSCWSITRCLWHFWFSVTDMSFSGFFLLVLVMCCLSEFLKCFNLIKRKIQSLTCARKTHGDVQNELTR